MYYLIFKIMILFMLTFLLELTKYFSEKSGGVLQISSMFALK